MDIWFLKKKHDTQKMTRLCRMCLENDVFRFSRYAQCQWSLSLYINSKSDTTDVKYRDRGFFNNSLNQTFSGKGRLWSNFPYPFFPYIRESIGICIFNFPALGIDMVMFWRQRQKLNFPSQERNSTPSYWATTCQGHIGHAFTVY